MNQSRTVSQRASLRRNTQYPHRPQSRYNDTTIHRQSKQISTQTMLYGTSTLISPTPGSDGSVGIKSSVEMASDEDKRSNLDVGGQIVSYTNPSRLRRKSSSPNTYPEMSQETQEAAELKDDSNRATRELRERKRRWQDSSSTGISP